MVIFLGLIAAVNFCGVLLFLLVEQPSANLEKLLLPGPPPPRAKTPATEETIHHQNGIATKQNGKIPEQNGNVPNQNGKIPEQHGIIPEQNGIQSTVSRQDSLDAKKD